MSFLEEKLGIDESDLIMDIAVMLRKKLSELSVEESLEFARRAMEEVKKDECMSLYSGLAMFGEDCAKRLYEQTKSKTVYEIIA
ncbi:MAG TPA: hypothetical protein VJ208_04290 [Candidatus Nanoarchaeia archaeon]|nr:hypothetical protein [Candidatus Nanoarchaeia archaeon]